MATDYLRRVEALEREARPHHRVLVVVPEDGENEGTARARTCAAAGVEDGDDVQVLLINFVDAAL